jgi:hypothetical protein
MNIQNLKLRFLFLCLLIAASSAVVSAQSKMYEPKKDSAERTAVMEGIRTYDVARNDDLSGEIFEVNSLRVQGVWAFASVTRSNLPEAGQGTGLAFLRRTGTAWKVMWSDFNDNEEVGVAAITRLRKKYKDLPKELAKFAENSLAG